MAKKKTIARKSTSTPVTKRGGGQNYSKLLNAIELANRQMVGRAATVVNQALVVRNWLIGAYIVEYEQGGADRAKYGAKLLERLSEDLAARGLNGLDARTLRDCRMLFQLYPQIRGPLEPELGQLPNPLLLPVVVEKSLKKRIRGPVDPELIANPVPAPGNAATELPTPLSGTVMLQFSWSQLLNFIRIEDPWKRAFYENECLKSRWSKRELKRQIESLLYERTGLSKNKRAMVERARKSGVAETVEDIIRDPYVLEFIGLAEREQYSEDELESALLDHLQRFLLELGEGFCFEARQFRITVNNKHERVDLVFYHRRLRCHVLIDLKIRAFRPADAGQMNFYLNWFKAHMMAEADNPPVGIILCSDKDGTEVEFATAGMDSQMFVSRYLVALPSAEQLRKFVEADRARIELQTKD